MKNRLNAFLAHLSISALVALMSIFVVFYLWYPSPLQNTLGVTKIFFLLLAIDGIMGPVMTFIVYQPKKKSLVFDLSVIGIMQLIALAYGMYTIYQGRPAFIVYNEHRFEVIRSIDLDVESTKLADNNHNKSAIVDWLSPHWVAAVPTGSVERQNKVAFSSAEGGADWSQLPDSYIPLKKIKPKLLKKANALSEIISLYKDDADVKEKLNQYVNKDFKWLPLRGKTSNMIVLINANSAEVIQVIDIDPWP